MAEEKLTIVDDTGKAYEVDAKVLAQIMRREFDAEMAKIDVASMPEDKRYEVVAEKLNKAALRAIEMAVPMSKFVTARVPIELVKDVSRASAVGSIGRKDLTTGEKVERFIFAALTGGLSTFYYVKKDREKRDKEK